MPREKVSRENVFHKVGNWVEKQKGRHAHKRVTKLGAKGYGSLKKGEPVQWITYNGRRIPIPMKKYEGYTSKKQKEKANAT